MQNIVLSISESASYMEVTVEQHDKYFCSNITKIDFFI